MPVDGDNTLQEPLLQGSQPALFAGSDTDLAKTRPAIAEVPTDRQLSEPASMSSDATLIAESETPSLSIIKAAGAHGNPPAVTDCFPAGESPFEKCFVRLPKDVQLSILEHAQLCIPRDQTGKQKVIRPWFKQGMRNDSYFPTISGDCTEPASDSMYADLYICQDNQTYLEASLVSRTFADRFIYLFYSTNTFHFEEPRAALWFFKSLGSRFWMIKNVVFSFESGLETYAKNATMTESYEELWYGVICWIQYRHNFQNLTIRIGHWPYVKRQRQAKAWMDQGSYTVSVDDEVIDEALMFRDKLVHRLCQIRGIRNPSIEDPKNKCLSNDEIVQIQLVMKQSAGRRFKAEKTIKELLEVSRERGYVRHNGIPEIKDQMMDLFESLQQEDEEDTTSRHDKQTAKKWWEDPGNYAKDDEDLPALIEARSKDGHRQLPTEWGFDPMESSTQNRDNEEQVKRKEKEQRRSLENDQATNAYYSIPGSSAYRPREYHPISCVRAGHD